MSNTIAYDDEYESNARLKGNHSSMNTYGRPMSNPKNRRLEPLPPQPNSNIANTIQLNPKGQKMVYPLNRRNIEILENMNNANSILKS